MTVTQKDIAREVGVSQTVVSDVLQGRPRGRVRPEVRERILEAAQRLAYRPNASARALRSRHSRQVIYLALQPEGRSRSLLGEEILPGLVEALAEEDHRVLLHVTRRAADVVSDLKGLLAAGQGDAFIFRGVDLSSTLLEELRRLEQPFVVIGQCANSRVASVAHDVDAMVRGLVERLVREGHRRIALLDQPGSSDYDRLIREAWSSTLAQGLFEGRAEIVADRTAASAQVDRWLEMPDAPTAVVCRSEVLYVGAVSATQRRGRTPGREIGLGLLGAQSRSWLLEPGTWCAAARHEEIGRIAGQEIVRQLGGEPPSGPVRLRLEPYRA